ncbi:lysozyme [Methylovorus sp. MM2]|uniref:N-acetylmuramoyl-L-alanine amidase n=1 Tax=Methylovorus sp. MM2 TaxID=1848038 RepID=UPI0007E02AC0|nr:N-acetylmuramoyl-L-alanine amidase [Methylovorus sp. MM2]OAM52903.1 lysozyme [Methylovorus sp. MM2]
MASKPLTPEAVKYLAVHCSATQTKTDLTAADIDVMHRKRGFLKIGYHFVIRRNGTVEKGRDLTEVGAHVEGYNSQSLGICLVGGVDKDLKPENNFTPAQFNALSALLKDLSLKFPKATVQGHRDFPNVKKDCPCFDVKPWWLKHKD